MRAATSRSQMTFDSLGLSADLLQTVAEEGYVEPTRGEMMHWFVL